MIHSIALSPLFCLSISPLLTRFSLFFVIVCLFCPVHCWCYRRYAAGNAHNTLKQEFEFTNKKIEDNFSNYSAWHQRSALIPQLFQNDKGNIYCYCRRGVRCLFLCLFTFLALSSSYWSLHTHHPHTHTHKHHTQRAWKTPCNWNLSWSKMPSTQSLQTPLLGFIIDG